MIKITLSILLCGILLTLSGCFSTRPQAQVQLIQGSYYITGDKICPYWKPGKTGFINCYNSEGNLKGYRPALTSQELQQISDHRQQISDEAPESRELMRDAARAFAEAAEDINKNTPKTTYTNCYRSFDNSVNCSSTTP